MVKWLRGPGEEVFHPNYGGYLGQVNIIAEDLGIITPEVEILRDDLGFPGNEGPAICLRWQSRTTHFSPTILPHLRPVVYTGTHDNDTTVGWFLSDRLDDRQRENIKFVASRDRHDQRGSHQDLIYLAQSSISILCIFPLQDILGFGGDCKMNSPGLLKENGDGAVQQISDH